MIRASHVEIRPCSAAMSSERSARSRWATGCSQSSSGRPLGFSARVTYQRSLRQIARSGAARCSAAVLGELAPPDAARHPAAAAPSASARRRPSPTGRCPTRRRAASAAGRPPRRPRRPWRRPLRLTPAWLHPNIRGQRTPTRGHDRGRIVFRTWRSHLPLGTAGGPAIEGATHVHSGKVRDLYRSTRAARRAAADGRQRPDLRVRLRAGHARSPTRARSSPGCRCGGSTSSADLVPNHVVSTDVPAAVARPRRGLRGARDVSRRVRGPRLPHRLRPARLPRHRRGLRHRAARRARGRPTGCPSRSSPRRPRPTSASTTRTSPSTRSSRPSAPTRPPSCAT